MKIFALLAAVCLLGTTSCSKKLCPAYSKTDSVQQNTYAKDVSPSHSGVARI
jgi:hypothetical protein